MKPKKLKVLLIAPPRYYWAFINDYDNFMVPQGLPALAAMIREDHDVRIIDCLPLHLGWASLEKEIRDFAPDVVAAGENHAAFAAEVLKLFNLVRSIDPAIVTVAGGTHFTFLVDYIYGKYPHLIDYIVKGEGELIFRDLIAAIAGKGDPLTVRGIAYMYNGKLIETPPMPLADLDALPMPAYNLLPMDKYGNSKYLFGSYGSTIHHSRGCVSGCDFCAFWIQMAERKQKDGKEILIPTSRTKSVEKTMAEVSYLYHTFGKRFFVFVDDTFNLNPKWNEAFADAVIASGMRFEWYAFMRADFILRDEKLGIFEKLVKAGLIQVSVGAERISNEDLSGFNKGFYTHKTLVELSKLLRTKYPTVFRQFTFIVGLENETRETMRAQGAFARELHADYPGFHPLTPIPGTKLWREFRAKGLIEIEEFEYYDWMTPIIASKHMTRAEISEELFNLSKEFVNVPWFVAGILSRSRYKRNMFIWWLIVTATMTVGSLTSFINPMKLDKFRGLVKPDWYDS